MENGGSIFPTPDTRASCEDPDYPGSGRMGWITLPGHKGLTLRDYFAANALLGLMPNHVIDNERVAKEVARNCYMLADAMLAERDK